MAGFASSAERWADFDGEWRNRLADDGLPYFHMQPFTQSVHQATGPFDETWIGKEKEPRRQKLLMDLMGIIQAHAWQKFACILSVDSFRMFSEESRRDFVPTMIATAGRLIWADVESWRRRERFLNPARIVMEDGDLKKGTLIEAIKHVTGREPFFGSKKDIREKGIVAFTPLQAADILAYEMQKLTQRFEDRLDGMSLRFPYHQLEQIPGGIKVLGSKGTEMLDEIMRVTRYFDTNPLGSQSVRCADTRRRNREK
jgi:hypothetical protein